MMSKSIDQIAHALAKGRYDADGDAAKIAAKIVVITKVVATATVAVKKISVSKKAPNRWSTFSDLNHRGLWGYPKVYIVHGAVQIPLRSEFSLAPFLLELGESGSYELCLDRPAIPDLFAETWSSRRHKSPWTIEACSQHNTADLGAYLAKNCPALHDLDRRVREAWTKQREAFPKEADRYIDKLGDKQRTNFQQKLAKEFGAYKCELTSMSAANLYEIFLFTRDHASALQSLVNFCRRNRADSVFIDESDVEAAMRLAEIADVHDA